MHQDSHRGSKSIPNLAEAGLVGRCREAFDKVFTLHSSCSCCVPQLRWQIPHLLSA